ncbi:hypothetical protein [Nonomuraea sp. NPDC049709]|uniref:hypothetical protein n=1 Tax=Nonomuraea sp. NPDC049709 TaxID=3154736 RepID=UPI00342530C7
MATDESDVDPIFQAQNDALLTLGWMAGCLGVIAVTAFAAAGEVVGGRWPVLGTALLGAAVLLNWAGAIYAALSLWGSGTPPTSAIERDYRSSPFFSLLFISLIAASAASVLSFGEFARHLHMAAGGFQAANTDVLPWMMFSLGEWVDAITLGSAAIYGGVSDIKATAFWSRTFVVLPYHLVATVVLFGAIKHGVAALRGRRAHRPST